MKRQGPRIIMIYLVALSIGLGLHFDHLGPLVESWFDDAPPLVLRQMLEAVSTWRQDWGLERLTRSFDCALVPVFGENYKNAYYCGEPALAKAKPSEALGRVQADKPGIPAPLGEDQATPKAQSGICSLMVVGDSLAVSLGLSLERALRGTDGLAMIPKGKIASGLQNPHFYDWGLAVRQFMLEYEPDVVVVMMGVNDAKYLSLDARANPVAFVRDKQFAVYEERAKRFVAALDEGGVKSYWIGLPIMGDTELAAKCQALNSVIRQVCEDSKACRYVDIWGLLADRHGQYADYLPDGKGDRIKVRLDDRIHFSAAGGDIIAKALFKEVDELSSLVSKQNRRLAENESSRPGTLGQ